MENTNITLPTRFIEVFREFLQKSAENRDFHDLKLEKDMQVLLLLESSFHCDSSAGSFIWKVSCSFSEREIKQGNPSLYSVFRHEKSPPKPLFSCKFLVFFAFCPQHKSEHIISFKAKQKMHQNRLIRTKDMTENVTPYFNSLLVDI